MKIIEQETKIELLKNLYGEDLEDYYLPQILEKVFKMELDEEYYWDESKESFFYYFTSKEEKTLLKNKKFNKIIRKNIKKIKNKDLRIEVEKRKEELFSLLKNYYPKLNIKKLIIDIFITYLKKKYKGNLIEKISKEGFWLIPSTSNGKRLRLNFDISNIFFSFSLSIFKDIFNSLGCKSQKYNLGNGWYVENHILNSKEYKQLEKESQILKDLFSFSQEVKNFIIETLKGYQEEQNLERDFLLYDPSILEKKETIEFLEKNKKILFDFIDENKKEIKDKFIFYSLKEKEWEYWDYLHKKYNKLKYIFEKKEIKNSKKYNVLFLYFEREALFDI